MKVRFLPNWLKGYEEYTQESEAPETFHLWTGLSVLASAVRRNVWLNQGIYLLYPNLFVILVAPPGKIGKSTVTRMGRKILQSIEDLQMGPDSLTREELIRLMAAAGSSDRLSSDITIHSTELSSLIEPSGIKMIQFLTDIYDCDYDNPTGWRYSTKSQGRNKIYNPVLNLLAATTPSWIAEGFPESVISHGFTARTIFIYEDSPRFDNPFPKEPSKDIVRMLCEDLTHIATLKGCFDWTEDARTKYVDFYKDLRANIPADHRIEGYYNRKRIHVLKIAMLLSLAQNDSLVIEERDLEVAIQLLKIVEHNMPKTFSAVGKYDLASDLERIENQLHAIGRMKISDFYKKNYFVGDSKTLQGILTSLRIMGKIKVVGRGSEAEIVSQ